MVSRIIPGFDLNLKLEASQNYSTGKYLIRGASVLNNKREYASKNLDESNFKEMNTEWEKKPVSEGYIVCDLYCVMILYNIINATQL